MILFRLEKKKSVCVGVRACVCLCVWFCGLGACLEVAKRKAASVRD